MGFWDAYNSAYAAAKQGALQQSNQQIGDALASGDYDGATALAYKSGNPQYAQSISALAQQKAQQDRNKQIGALLVHPSPASVGSLGAPPMSQGSLSGATPDPTATGSLSPPGPPVAGSLSPPAAPVAAPASAAPVAMPDLMTTLSAPPPPSQDYNADNLRQADNIALQAGDFEQHKQLQSYIQTATEDQQKQAAVKATAMAKVAADAANITSDDDTAAGPSPTTLAKRKAFVIAQAPYLARASGGTITAEQLQSFSPTDENLSSVVSLPQTLEQHIAYAKQQSDAASAAAKEQFAETHQTAALAEEAKNHRATEAIGRTNAGANVSRAGSAAESAATGRLSYSARLAQHGFGTAGAVAGGGAGTDDEPPE